MDRRDKSDRLVLGWVLGIKRWAGETTTTTGKEKGVKMELFKNHMTAVEMEQKGKQSDSKFILLCLLHSLTKSEASTQPGSLPHPSPSLNSIRKRIYRLWKYFRSTKKRQASDAKAKSFVEEFFCRWNCWKIKHSEREIEKVFIHRERRWRQRRKKAFSLNIYSLRCWNYSLPI